MATYLFITNPEEYDTDSVRRGDDPSWSCSKTGKTGDSIFMYHTGGKGIVLEWRAASDAEPSDEWKYECQVEYVRAVQPPISIQELRQHFTRSEWPMLYTSFRGARSLVLKPEIAERLAQLRPARGKRGVAPSPTPDPNVDKREMRAKYGSGGEGKEHRNLKEYVCKHPHELGLRGVTQARVERRYDTGDRVDVAFEIGSARVVVEIEVEGDAACRIGALQAVKYRALEAATAGHIDTARVRAFLVAHGIGPKTRTLCRRLAVEAVEIPRRQGRRRE